MDLFDIDFHIFTVIKFLFNLGVRFNYIERDLNILDRKSSKILQHPHGLTLHVETYKQRLSRRAPIIIVVKLAFGEEYDKLYPGSIYSPPS